MAQRPCIGLSWPLLRHLLELRNLVTVVFGNFSGWIRKLVFGNFPVGFGNCSGWIRKLFPLYLETSVFWQLVFGNCPVGFGNCPVGFGNFPIGFGNFPIGFDSYIVVQTSTGVVLCSTDYSTGVALCFVVRSSTEQYFVVVEQYRVVLE